MQEGFVRPWTSGLEWYAQNVTQDDFQHFDYVLAGASERVHAHLVNQAALKPVNNLGQWRLYRVVEN